MIFNKQSSPSRRSNRFESAEALRHIYEKLDQILKLLSRLDHSNLLRVHDYWFVENDKHAKLVVITEYSSGGSLRRLLDASISSKSSARGRGGDGRVKVQTSRRWLNQTVHLLRCLHHGGISLFQGAFNADTIFIQSCGVIKLAPVLLALNGLCVWENGVFRSVGSGSGPLIDLNDEYRVRYSVFFHKTVLNPLDGNFFTHLLIIKLRSI